MAMPPYAVLPGHETSLYNLALAVRGPAALACMAAVLALRAVAILACTAAAAAASVLAWHSVYGCCAGCGGFTWGKTCME